MNGTSLLPAFLLACSFFFQAFAAQANDGAAILLNADHPVTVAGTQAPQAPDSTGDDCD